MGPRLSQDSLTSWADLFHAKGVLSYSSYIEEAAALAVKHNTTPEVVEVALFRSTARTVTGS